MNCCHRGHCLVLVDVPGPEEELPVQVALLDHVHVSDGDIAAIAAQPHHCKVLEQFATNGACAYNEILLLPELLLEPLTKYGNLAIVTGSLWRALLLSEGCFETIATCSLLGQTLNSIKVQPLEDWMELATGGLHHLLGHNATQGGTHGAHLTSADHCKLLHKTLVLHLVAKLLLSERQESICIRSVPGSRQGACVLLLPGVESLVAEVQLRWSRELGKVGDDRLHLVHGGRQWLEAQHLGLLHLHHNASTLVLAESLRVSNAEGVGSGHLDLELLIIDLRHATHFREFHHIPILQTVPGLIKGSDNCLCVLGDRCNHSRNRRLSSGVDDVEPWTKVSENLGVQPATVRHNHGNVIGVGDLVDPLLLHQAAVGEHNHGVLLDQILRDGSSFIAHCHIAVQLCSPLIGGLSPVSTNIGLPEEELAAKIGNLNFFGVMEGDGLDPTEDHILGDLHPQPLKSADQDRGVLHPLHRLLAKDKELPGVEAFINLPGSRSTIVLRPVHSVPVLRHISSVPVCALLNAKAVAGGSNDVVLNLPLLGWGGVG